VSDGLSSTAERVMAAAPRAGARPCVLLMPGEAVLKGRNRRAFIAALERNLRAAAARAGRFRLERRGSGVLLMPPDGDLRPLLEAVAGVPGFSVVQPSLRVARDLHAAARAAVELLRGLPGDSFAVRARRRDKRFPIPSPEIARLLGGEIQAALGLAVDLGAPAREVHAEVYAREVLVSLDRLRGAGGLPVGTSGRALALLSGGIDSPVAAYRMIRRGLRCDFVHFSGRPLTGAESAFKAYAQVARLARFQGRSRLFVVPFGRAQRLLAAAGAGRLQVLAQRRIMVRVAGALAAREGCQALVTGDSLGQVSSQTLRNLEVVQSASSLPLLRPLLDRDKDEIVAEARRLGTYEISILPDEDCCTLLAHPRAVTWADPGALEQLERQLDVEAIVEELLATAELLWPRLHPADEGSQPRRSSRPTAAISSSVLALRSSGSGAPTTQ
jgi:thiamine biosynthesis protein ThiI